MKTKTLQFSEKVFSILHPSYIEFDAALRIMSHGSYFPPAITIKKDDQLNDHFRWLSGKPLFDNELLKITDYTTNILLQSNYYPFLAFSGKMVRVSANRLLFLGQPVFLFRLQKEQLTIDVSTNELSDSSAADVFHYYGIDQRLADHSPRVFVMLGDGSIDTETYNEPAAAITISDENGHVVWCNSHFEKITGKHPAEIYGKRPRDSVYGEKSIYIEKDFVDSNVEKGEPFYFENIGYYGNGKEFWLGTSVRPVFNDQNKIVGRIHSMKDISERKSRDIELVRNDTLLTLALEAAQAGAWYYNFHSEEIIVSENYKKILHLPLEQPMTVALFNELIHPEDRSDYSQNVLPYISYNKPAFSIETRMLVEGSYQYFTTKGKCIEWDAQKRPVALVGTLREITKEKFALVTSEQQKKYYIDILDETPADIVIFDTDHKYQFVSKQAIKNDEIRNWIIGKNDFDYCKLKNWDVGIAAQRQKVFNDALETGKPQKYIDSRLVDGVMLHKMRSYVPMMDDKGAISHVIGYSIDITEQFESERSAQLQKERLENFLEIVNDGIFQFTPDGTLLSYNRSFAAFLDAQLLDGPKDNFFSFFAGSGKAEAQMMIDHLQTTGILQKGTISSIRLADNTERFLEYLLIRDHNDGTAAGLTGRLTDVTDILLRETNLKQHLDAERSLNKQKSEFIRIASHELRTPLTIINSNAEILEMLLSRPDLPQAKDPFKILKRITGEVETMTSILNELMMVTKIESGITIEKEPVNVAEFFVQNIAGLFMPYTDGRALKLTIDSSVKFWLFDPKLMTHALVNLLRNAFKYSVNKPAPTIEITTDDDQLFFLIKDEGIGIPQSEIGSLFKPFFRASNAVKEPGTGVGLTIVDYAVKKHGGRILVSSELYKGSVFKICIPKY